MVHLSAYVLDAENRIEVACIGSTRQRPGEGYESGVGGLNPMKGILSFAKDVGRFHWFFRDLAELECVQDEETKPHFGKVGHHLELSIIRASSIAE